MDEDVDWALYDFGDEPKKAGVVKAAPVSTFPAKSCQKCGKALGRGGHFHVKACKGQTDDDAR